MIIKQIGNNIKEGDGSLVNYIINLQKFAVAGHMFSDLTHELNNIVGAMLGFAQIAKMTNEENDIKKCFEVVISCSEKAKSLNTNMLSYLGRNSQDVGDVDINFIIQQSISLACKGFDRKGIRVIFEPKSIPIIKLKLGLFQHAFLNLLLDIKKNISPGKEVKVVTGFNKEQNLIEIALSNGDCDISAKKCFEKIRSFQDIFNIIDNFEDVANGIEAEVAYWILVKEIGGELIIDRNSGNGLNYIIKLHVA